MKVGVDRAASRDLTVLMRINSTVHGPDLKVFTKEPKRFHASISKWGYIAQSPGVDSAEAFQLVPSAL